ncbi:hypothetical protein T492DRAFT_868644 [Pavlovales sp. CCMP2436]|nr:hypothetical protein T492DRAFT_868644 [Pavlovales sp. CCMP2436]
MLSLILVALSVHAHGRSARTGAPLEPLPVHSSGDSGKLRTSLRISEFTYTSPSGASFNARGFDGGFSGPVLRFRAGDTVHVSFTNALGGANATAGTSDEHNTYTYQIPTFHMAGVHWMHPHHHDSTSLQVGGGVAGIMIVEDASGEVPDEVGEMDEVVLLLAHLDSVKISQLESSAGGSLYDVQGGDDVDIVLVNGQHEPATMQVQLDGCELALLAKDGVYLPIAPRIVSSLSLYPGARVDFASGTLATIIVSGTAGSGVDLSFFSVHRPCYLVDLRSAPVDNTFSIDFAGRDVNGERLAMSPVALTTIAAGTVSEWRVFGLSTHIFHLHINPYQITAGLSTDASGYFHTGDWHDTLHLPNSNSVTVRLQADTFVGTQVLHCHKLEHEDEGMMAITTITGTEGTTWAGARDREPTCYTDGTRGYTIEQSNSVGSAALWVIAVACTGTLCFVCVAAAVTRCLFLRRRVRKSDVESAPTSIVVASLAPEQIPSAPSMPHAQPAVINQHLTTGQGRGWALVHPPYHLAPLPAPPAYEAPFPGGPPPTYHL